MQGILAFSKMKKENLTCLNIGFYTDNGNYIQFGSIMTSVLYRPGKESSISSFHSHIRTLENENRKLEAMLKLRINDLNENFQIHQNLQTRLMQSATSFKQQHSDLHQVNSNNLIVRQIKLQEESEMKEIIENYQQRIMELQSSLISKEDEIIEQIYEGQRQKVPRKENMQVLNKDSHQKLAIKRALQDLKKLKVQIDALEYNLNSKTQKIKSLNTLKEAETLLSQTKSITRQENGVSKGKDKTNGLYQDKLLFKVYKILDIELAREEVLKKQIAQLKHEWKRQSKQHQQFIQSFKNQGNKTMTLDLKNPSSKNENINFLDQLYKAEIKQNKEHLFSKVDQNVGNMHKVKSEKKKTVSREKLGKVNKQN